MTDTDGNLRTVEGPAYYIPAAKIRILSPQTLFRPVKKGRLIMDYQSLILELPDGGTVVITEFESNLPFATAMAVDFEREENDDDSLLFAMPTQTSATDPDH